MIHGWVMSSLESRFCKLLPPFYFLISFYENLYCMHLQMKSYAVKDNRYISLFIAASYFDFFLSPFMVRFCMPWKRQHWVLTTFSLKYSSASTSRPPVAHTVRRRPKSKRSCFFSSISLPREFWVVNFSLISWNFDFEMSSASHNLIK